VAAFRLTLVRLRNILAARAGVLSRAGVGIMELLLSGIEADGLPYWAFALVWIAVMAYVIFETR